MIIILVLLFYFSQSPTTAIPLTNTYGDILARNTSTLSSVVHTACTCHDQRSIWDIVWSCLTTIFACTWVSVHSDIPDPDERWWMIVARRVELVIWTLLTPELIIFWAMNQWKGARMVAREQKDKGWGETHGYFMEMGGFMLYKGNQKMGTLSYFRFKELLAKNRIKFPTTTEEEIKDRSKSDGLSKFLVIGQTGWFILQCITRRVEKLPITELELATLAFAALNGCMYFFWWNKPFDVRSPVPVKLRNRNSDKVIDARINSSRIDKNKSSQEEQDQEADTAQSEEKWSVEGNYGSEESALVSIDADLNTAEIHIPYQQTAWFQAVTLPWTALKMIGSRVAVMFIGQSTFSEFNNTRQPEAEVGPMRVPTFHSLATSDGSPIGLAVFVIGPIFGAIHCAGWFFHFPTTAELWIWRISSLYIAIYPFLMLFTFFGYGMLKHWEHSESPILRALYAAIVMTLVLFLMVGLFLYSIARFLLLAECLTTLRDLPPGAYDIVQWTIRIPHI